MRASLCVLLSAALALSSGCAHFVTCVVKVIDAETLEPIPGAEVSVGYVPWPKGALITPSEDEGITDSEGVVRLRAAADGRKGIYPDWDVEAPGYFPRFTRDNVNVMQQIEAITRRGGKDETVGLTLRGGRKPAPTCVVTLPTGYRGFVRVCLNYTAGSPSEPHRRRFECVIDEHGRCELPPIPILAVSGVLLEYEFRFDDGTPLPVVERDPSTAGGDTLAAWEWFQDDERCMIFVIASESVAAAEMIPLWPNGPRDESIINGVRERSKRGPFPKVEGAGRPSR